MSLKESESREQLVGARSSTTKLLPTPVTVSGVSFVSTTWLLVTFAVVVALVVAAAAPYWMKNEDPDQLGNPVNSVYLGLYYFCYELPLDTDVYCKDDLSTVLDDACCTTYGDFNNPVNLSIGPTRLEEIDSDDDDDIGFLFTASGVYTVAVVLLIVSLVFGVMAYCKPRISNFSVFAIAFIFQICASISLVAALVLFPFSFESDFLQQFCGSRASYYYRGQCSLDWSLYVAMVATACSFYLPSLAIFAMNISDGFRAHICC